MFSKIKFRYVTIAALSVVSVACFKRTYSSQSTPYIWGGQEVISSDSFSSGLVNLRGLYRSTNCSGAIIHPRVIITATHCFSAPFKILLGFNQESPTIETQILPQDFVDVPHPNYINELVTGKTDNDIALIFLNKALDKEVYKPLLFPKSVLLNSAANLHVIGFGATENLNSSLIAKWASVKIKSIDEAAGRYFIETITGNILSGDSGGPVISLDENKVPTIIEINIAAGKIRGQKFTDTSDSTKKGSVGVINATYFWKQWINDEFSKRGLSLL